MREFRILSRFLPVRRSLRCCRGRQTPPLKGHAPLRGRARWRSPWLRAAGGWVLGWAWFVGGAWGWGWDRNEVVVQIVFDLFSAFHWIHARMLKTDGGWSQEVWLQSSYLSHFLHQLIIINYNYKTLHVHVQLTMLHTFIGFVIPWT